MSSATIVTGTLRVNKTFTTIHSHVMTKPVIGHVLIVFYLIHATNVRN